MLYNMSYPQDQPRAQAGGPQPGKPVVVAAAAAVARPRQRCSQPMPFDPEELSQKLAKVLADQKLQAERRRRARAAETAAPSSQNKESAAHPPHASMAREYLDQGSLKPGHRSANKPVAAQSNSTTNNNNDEKPVRENKSAASERSNNTKTSARPGSKISEDDRRSSKLGGGWRKGSSGEKHPYIPQFAASQFARTTTVEGGMSENKSLVHKLSRTALRIAQVHRERHQQERNNFRQDRIPETAEMDSHHHHHERAHRGDRSHHRHTFDGPLGGAAETAHQTKLARRLSAGDVLMAWDSGTSSPDPYHYDNSEETDQHHPYEHRVDWTQSDEAAPVPQKSKPSLRKADSIWALKSRLGAFTKHRQQESPLQDSVRDGSPASDTMRSPKSGFWYVTKHYCYSNAVHLVVHSTPYEWTHPKADATNQPGYTHIASPP